MAPSATTSCAPLMTCRFQTEAAGYYPPAMAELDKLYVEGQPHEFQDRFYYFLGRFFQLGVEDYERAVALLEKVRSESELYPRALYALGSMQGERKIATPQDSGSELSECYFGG